MALIKGDLAALRLLPRMLRKRRSLEAHPQIDARPTPALAASVTRISLKELTEQAI